MENNLKCDFHVAVLVIIVILIIAFIDEIFVTFPVLNKLFTDPINFILVIVLVILILLIDMPSGIILSFLVLYNSIWVKSIRKHNKDRFEDIQTTKALIPQYLAESELLYNKNKDKEIMPNKNLQPFKPEENKPQPAEFKSTIETNQHDNITQNNKPNKDCYDYAGCRYDYKNSPQNLTKFGPPLALNSTYNCEKAATCGSLFYPLHG